MKSWYDLTKEEQNKYIKEFRSKYNGVTGEKLHDFNKCLLIFIIPITIFIILRIMAETDENMFFIKIIDIILIVLYFLNVYKIKKENDEFKKYLSTKKIIK